WASGPSRPRSRRPTPTRTSGSDSRHMIEPPIRRAEPVEGKALAQVIADAFHALPITAWLVPDPADRREIMPANFQLFVDHAIEHGTVHTTDRLDAVAVWFADA